MSKRDTAAPSSASNLSAAAACFNCSRGFSILRRRRRCAVCEQTMCRLCSYRARSGSGFIRICEQCKPADAVPSPTHTPRSTSSADLRVWQADDESSCCTKCASPFSMFDRRHHCRACLQLFCGRCSAAREHVGGVSGPRRVCSDCLAALAVPRYVARHWVPDEDGGKYNPGREQPFPVPMTRLVPGPAPGTVLERLERAGADEAVRFFSKHRAPAQVIAAGQAILVDGAGEDIAHAGQLEDAPRDAPGLPTAWLIMPDSCVLKDVCQRDMVRLLSKLHRLESFLRKREGVAVGRDPIPEELRLTFTDFKALTLAEDFSVQIDWWLTEFSQRELVPFFHALAAACQSQAVNAHLHAACLRGLNIGDVVFYDLKNRKLLGEVDVSEWTQSLFYDVQRRYDRFAHSGLFVTVEDRNAILHSVGSDRVKVFWQTAPLAFMAKREVDFSKVFGPAWRDVPEVEQALAVAQYRSGMIERAGHGAQVLNPCTSLSEYVGCIRTSAKALPGGLDDEPRRRWRLTWKSDGAEAAEKPPPVMCSGFTASVLLEVWCEMLAYFKVRAAQLRSQGMAEDADALLRLRLQRCVKRETLRFTPKDLHAWAVWRDEVASPPGVFDFIASEIREGYAGALLPPS